MNLPLTRLCALALALASFGAAAQEKVINLYSSRHYNTDEALYGNFTKQTGIKINRIEAGEDPLYIARRLVRFASEDIGNADPQALTVAVAAKEAAHFIGMPEGNTALAQAAIYLATAPKSNAVYVAYGAAARGYIDDVILPHETRRRLVRGLEMLADKRDSNPPKKHGNIPL